MGRRRFKAKKSKSYGSRLEELEDVVEYMRKEAADVGTAHDIVMEVHRQRNEASKKLRAR